VAHRIGHCRWGQHDARKTRITTAIHLTHPRHRQTGRIHAIHPAGHQQIIGLNIVVGRDKPQLHQAAFTAPKRSGAVARAWVEHRNGSITVDQQRHLGGEEIHPADLPKHASFVNHR